MKKVILIFAFAVFGIANAQKGTILVAGNLSYKSTNNPVDADYYLLVPGDNKSSSFEFSPKVGYQFTNNLTVGIESSIGSEKRSDFVTSYSQNNIFFSQVDIKKTSLNLGAFLRYSKSLGGIFSSYADLSAGIISGKVTKTLYGMPGDNKYHGLYAGITPAFAIDLKKALCINFSFGGLKYSSVESDFFGSKTATFDFDLGKQINIGISKNF